MEIRVMKKFLMLVFVMFATIQSYRVAAAAALPFENEGLELGLSREEIADIHKNYPVSETTTLANFYDSVLYYFQEKVIHNLKDWVQEQISNMTSKGGDSELKGQRIASFVKALRDKEAEEQEKAVTQHLTPGKLGARLQMFEQAGGVQHSASADILFTTGSVKKGPPTKPKPQSSPSISRSGLKATDATSVASVASLMEKRPRVASKRLHGPVVQGGQAPITTTTRLKTIIEEQVDVTVPTVIDSVIVPEEDPVGKEDSAGAVLANVLPSDKKEENEEEFVPEIVPVVWSESETSNGASVSTEQLKMLAQGNLTNSVVMQPGVLEEASSLGTPFEDDKGEEVPEVNRALDEFVPALFELRESIKSSSILDELFKKPNPTIRKPLHRPHSPVCEAPKKQGIESEANRIGFTSIMVEIDQKTSEIRRQMEASLGIEEASDGASAGFSFKTFKDLEEIQKVKIEGDVHKRAKEWIEYALRNSKGFFENAVELTDSEKERLENKIVEICIKES